MRVFQLVFAGGVLAILAACEPTTTGGGTDGAFAIPQPADPCGVGNLGRLVGKPTSALTNRRLYGNTRFVAAGSELGRDIDVNRRTVFVDQAGRITRIVCA